MELRVKATDESMQAVNDFIHSIIPQDCDAMLLNQIDLAVEEIFVNIAHYSGSDEAVINCTYEVSGAGIGILQIVFIDSGKPFNPLEKEDPDITLSVEDRQIGGLGIYMVKNIMDSVTYEHTDGQNILTVEKNF